MEIDLAWLLLLPVFFSLGWSIARYDRYQRRGELDAVSQHVLRGLSSVLSKQYDQATEELIQAAGLAPDTPDLHRAVGNLYRARGLVDRAIEVHETALRHPNLSVSHRAALMVDLAHDYVAAGLFDRAEDVLVDLLNHTSDPGAVSPSLANEARRLLVNVFQTTRDWRRALYWLQEAHQHQAVFTPHSYEQLMGHMHCELADEALAKQDIGAAEAALSMAQTFDAPGVAQRCAVLRIRIAEAQNGSSASGSASASANASGAAAPPDMQACSVCGFRSRTMAWQCPACHHWDTFKPSR